MEVTSPVLATQPASVSDCLTRLARSGGSPRPLSVYRMQFHAGWKFEDARRLVPYLHALGVTHLYSSPILKARAGSMHGYDIIDHNLINPEIGTEEEFKALVRDLKAAGMGVILDFVPNHMGVGHGTNPWWQDVLENGESSAYARFFDIDWEPLKAELRGKVLLPVLGNQYGQELDDGKLQVRWEDGTFRISYFDKRFSIDPQTYPMMFEQSAEPQTGGDEQELRDFSDLLARFHNLPARTSSDLAVMQNRQQNAPRLKGQLVEMVERSSAVRVLLERALQRINGTPGDSHSFDQLHRLLEAQAYRLAHWMVSAEEINYRRFFDINDLVGLRMEDPEVFAATHRLIRRLLAEGSIDGMRLDHPDGLLNPVQYFTRLQTLYAASQCCGPQPQGPVGENGIELQVQEAFSNQGETKLAGLYVLVEKILEPGEQLPEGWAVDGTVGYEFGNMLTNLFVDGQNRRAFTNLYQRFIGDALDPDDVIYESKKLILQTALASEVAVLAHQLQAICSSDRYARDFTLKILYDTIREVIAAFPVYRTYIDLRGNISARDRAYIQEAVARAKRRNESSPASAFDFLREILLLSGNSDSAERNRRQLYFTMKFQQLTGPTMAKGLEDTACYIYNRLVAVNEVGGSPREFGIAVEEFHRVNQFRAEHWPSQLLNTSTHDSKRSEDVRARLEVLSEMPKTWSGQVMRWRRANRTKKRIVSDGRTVPDHNEEYLLYQTLVGAWPFRLQEAAERAEFTRRIQEYMNKAVHEAKVNLSWTNPNPEYIEALNQFIAPILEPGGKRRPNQFLQQIEAFLPTVLFFGALNSLSQTAIKLTVPGVPDIYQGNEMFDFSLVDPDNRRPVDYDVREQAMSALLRRAPLQDHRQFCDGLLADYQDGRAKLWTTVQTLRFRRDHRELMREGSYTPLEVTGEKQDHIVAFSREHASGAAMTVAPRLMYSLMQGQTGDSFSEAWGNTRVLLPRTSPPRLTNVYTGEVFEPQGYAIECGQLFRCFPVALLAPA